MSKMFPDQMRAQHPPTPPAPTHLLPRLTSSGLLEPGLNRKCSAQTLSPGVTALQAAPHGIASLVILATGDGPWLEPGHLPFSGMRPRCRPAPQNSGSRSFCSRLPMRLPYLVSLIWKKMVGPVAWRSRGTPESPESPQRAGVSGSLQLREEGGRQRSTVNSQLCGRRVSASRQRVSQLT